MAENNFQKTHIQSMNHAIADDWKGRLAPSFSEGGVITEESTQSIVNVLCGRQEGAVKLALEEETFKKRATDLIENELLKKMVGSVPQHLDCRPSNSVWRLTEPTDKLPATIERLTLRAQVMKLVDQFLIGTDWTRAQLFEKARRVKVWGSGENETSSHTHSHDTLMRGTLVQALVSDDSWGVVTPCMGSSAENATNHSIYYYAIEALLQDSDGVTYAAVQKCSVERKRLLMVAQGTNSQLLRLNDSARRICVVHACHGDPKLRCIRLSDSAIICTASILSGSKYYFFDRENGYPPRLA